MATAILVLLTAAMPTEVGRPGDVLLPVEALVAIADERGPHLVPPQRERSKKETWRLEKRGRPAVHLGDAELAQKQPRPAKKPARPAGPLNLQAEALLAEPMQPVGSCLEVVATLFNMWNRESLPLLVGQPYRRRFQVFLRDRYTQQATQADTRLAGVLAASAMRFRASRVEVVSGYRSPKYNLMLRKKGRQVARESQHVQGTAVDFRVYGVATEALREFVRSLRVGGVGYYPRTRFIHADTGKVRYWQGS